MEGKKVRVTSIWEREEREGGRGRHGGARGKEGEAGYFYTMTTEEVKEKFGGIV